MCSRIRTLRRSVAFIACLAAVLAHSAEVEARQDSRIPLRSLADPEVRFGDVSEQVLVGISAVRERGGIVIVGTNSPPFLHRFSEDGYFEWGSEGDGPAELDGVTDLVLLEDRVLVLNNNQHKIVSYGIGGAFLDVRLLDDWASRMEIVGSDTILFTFVPMSEERAVVRFRGERADTLFRYSRSAETVRLEAPGAPSYTTPLPHAPQIRATVLSDGRLAVWEPGASSIRVVDPSDPDRSTSVLFGPLAPGEPTTEADRELWVEDLLPDEFMGRVGIFDPLEDEARRVADKRFPERLPAVLEMLADPGGGVWVRRTTRATGERWVRFRSDGEPVEEIRLPVGRELMFVGVERFWMKGVDGLGVEVLEGYGGVPSR